MKYDTTKTQDIQIWKGILNKRKNEVKTMEYKPEKTSLLIQDSGKHGLRRKTESKRKQKPTLQLVDKYIQLYQSVGNTPKQAYDKAINAVATQLALR